MLFLDLLYGEVAVCVLSAMVEHDESLCDGGESLGNVIEGVVELLGRKGVGVVVQNDCIRFINVIKNKYFFLSIYLEI